MPIEKGMFVYPWTLREGDKDALIQTYAEQVGTNALYVNGSYHSGRFLQPLSEQKILTRHGSGLSFEPDISMYPEELQPVMDETVQPGLHEEIRGSCERHGVAYNSWIVGLHSSSLGRAHPQYCSKNIFGAVFDYALCPSQPVVRQYLKGLVRNVCTVLKPRNLLLETPNFIGYIHGHHHELLLSQLGPVGEYLMSLCFCPSCQQRGEEAGIDVDALQEIVRQRLSYLMEHERGGVSASFTHNELASMLVEEPLLYAYTQMRIDSVTSLIEALKEITMQHNVKLLAAPSVFTRPGSRAWQEGSGLRKLADVLDGFMLLTYFPNPDEVKADIEWLRMFAPDTPLHVAFNAGGADAPNQATLHSCVSESLQFAPESIVYYNASLLTRTRLEWIGKINREVGGR